METWDQKHHTQGHTRQDKGAEFHKSDNMTENSAEVSIYMVGHNCPAVTPPLLETT